MCRGKIRSAVCFFPEQKEHCAAFNGLLQATTNEPDFLKKFITGNESWVFGYDLEKKAQSSMQLIYQSALAGYSTFKGKPLEKVLRTIVSLDISEGCATKIPASQYFMVLIVLKITGGGSNVMKDILKVETKWIHELYTLQPTRLNIDID